jgi:hypothetical protein
LFDKLSLWLYHPLMIETENSNIKVYVFVDRDIKRATMIAFNEQSEGLDGIKLWRFDQKTGPIEEVRTRGIEIARGLEIGYTEVRTDLLDGAINAKFAEEEFVKISTPEVA